MSALTSDVPETALAALSDKSRACIERLRAHQPETANLLEHPASKLAAVLVLLYERAGELRVLLTTRSKELRSHPGQTALPGGKVDEGDGGVAETAFREAHEEVALPLRSPHVHALCTLHPFVSQHKLLVTPVVALLDDTAVLRALRAAPHEVAHIFDHPLEALLDPELARAEALVPMGSENWPYEAELHNFTDAHWVGGSAYRMHRFRSTASPVKGLTADILLAAAQVAYGRETVFQRWAPGQLKTFTEIQGLLDSAVVHTQPTLRPEHPTSSTTVSA
ncbi:NUDIX hydrolase domain-like protein [Gloeopeniophorella convolvens]|nr:NUDIX hydrolase domain-like protein [Gloeopeniophorella convolvens]